MELGCKRWLNTGGTGLARHLAMYEIVSTVAVAFVGFNTVMTAFSPTTTLKKKDSRKTQDRVKTKHTLCFVTKYYVKCENYNIPHTLYIIHIASWLAQLSRIVESISNLLQQKYK